MVLLDGLTEDHVTVCGKARMVLEERAYGGARVIREVLRYEEEVIAGFPAGWGQWRGLWRLVIGDELRGNDRGDCLAGSMRLSAGGHRCHHAHE